MESLVSLKSVTPSLAKTSPLLLQMVRDAEALVKQMPQTAIATHHLFHGGMYSRTINLPAGTVLAGALIKIPTVLVATGRLSVSSDEGPIELDGHQVVMPGSAWRKQGFYAHTDAALTMVFPTTAKTVEEAEAEFTDEVDQLFSKTGENIVVITGE